MLTREPIAAECTLLMVEIFSTDLVPGASLALARLSWPFLKSLRKVRKISWATSSIIFSWWTTTGATTAHERATWAHSGNPITRLVGNGLQRLLCCPSMTGTTQSKERISSTCLVKLVTSITLTPPLRAPMARSTLRDGEGPSPRYSRAETKSRPFCCNSTSKTEVTNETIQPTHNVTPKIPYCQ